MGEYDLSNEGKIDCDQDGFCAELPQVAMQFFMFTLFFVKGLYS